MLRKANIKDAERIHELIKFWARKNAVLERSLNYIFEHIRDYWVCEYKNKVVGACSLHVIGWQGLAEIKSLVVDRRYHRKGIGKDLVEACIEEARNLQAKSVFALTFVPNFFKKCGFKKIDKKKLPHKIWSDCVNCIYFPNCKEEALIFHLKKPRTNNVL